MSIKRLHLTTARWEDGRAVAGEAQRSADLKGRREWVIRGSSW
jgi:hypothetical protein